jgi:hypothetical protein
MNTIHRAVRFRESVDKGIGPNKSFPFIYNFVNRRDDRWVPQDSLTDYETNLAGCAPVVLAPGQTTQYAIQLDPDYNFMLLWFKYTVYSIFDRPAIVMSGTGNITAGSTALTGVLTNFIDELSAGNDITVGGVPARISYVIDQTNAVLTAPATATVAGGALINLADMYYIWYEPITGWIEDLGDYQNYIGTPLSRFISVSVNFRSDSRYLYGGQNLDSATGRGNNGLVPLPFSVLQGYDYGYGQLTAPYLLPKDGSILFEFTNNHTIKTLRVGGIAYGMKVRL